MQVISIGTATLRELNDIYILYFVITGKPPHERNVAFLRANSSRAHLKSSYAITRRNRSTLLT